jgi:hypothetical protein
MVRRSESFISIVRLQIYYSLKKVSIDIVRKKDVKSIMVL